MEIVQNEMISIIVPIYNMELYLERCVDSILKQTYTDLEIILIDDGSTDQSGEICDKYAIRDSRVKVIHQKNGGVASARNTGLQNASGRYIGWVDPDDYIKPEMYSTLMDTMKSEDADVVIGGYTNIGFEGKGNLIETEAIERYQGIAALGNAYENIYHEDGCEKMVVMWNKLWKREVFKNISFPSGKICEDAWVIHYALYQAKKVVVIHKSLYFYCYKNNSIMRTMFNENKLNTIYSVRDRAFFCKGKVEKNLLSHIFREYVNEVAYLDDTLKKCEIDEQKEKEIRRHILKLFRQDVRKMQKEIKMSRNSTLKLWAFYWLGWNYLKLPIKTQLFD